MPKTNKIDPTDDDFGTICICAVRYSIGRQTYMPKLVMDFIRPLLPSLTGRTLGVMEKDISEAGYYGSDTIDKPEWIRFLCEIREEQKRRK